jgi:hypothetical protein
MITAGNDGRDDRGNLRKMLCPVSGSDFKSLSAQCRLENVSGPELIQGLGISASGTNRRLEVGRSMSALPGYLRRQLVPLLPKHHPSTVRYLGIEVDDALNMAEQIEL